MLEKDELTLDKAIEQYFIIEMARERSDAMRGWQQHPTTVQSTKRKTTRRISTIMSDSGGLTK